MKRSINLGPFWWILVSVMVGIEGVNGLGSTVPLYRTLGVVALISAGAMLVSTFVMTGMPGRIRQWLGIPLKPGTDEMHPVETVRCTIVERLVPIVLTTLAILMMGAAAMYPARMVGLW